MKLPFVSRSIYESCDAERKRFLEIILRHGMGEALVQPQPVEIDPEKFKEAREEVVQNAKASMLQMFSRRPSAIASEMSRRKEEEYRKKYMPNNSVVAQMEEIEKNVGLAK